MSTLSMDNLSDPNMDQDMFGFSQLTEVLTSMLSCQARPKDTIERVLEPSSIPRTRSNSQPHALIGAQRIGDVKQKFRNDAKNRRRSTSDVLGDTSKSGSFKVSTTLKKSNSFRESDPLRKSDSFKSSGSRRGSATDLNEEFKKARDQGMEEDWHESAEKLKEIRKAIQQESRLAVVQREEKIQARKESNRQSGVHVPDHKADFDAKKKEAGSKQNQQLLRQRSIKHMKDHYADKHFSSDPSEVKVVKTKHAMKHYMGTGSFKAQPSIIVDQNRTASTLNPHR